MNFHYKHALNTAEAKIAENYNKTQKLDHAVKEGQKIIPYNSNTIKLSHLQ